MNILITGSTDGIGKLAAIKLAQDGHHIYMHGRNPEKLVLAINEVKTAANNSNVHGFLGDLSETASVKKLAQDIKSQVSQLDVLINNAGIFKSPIYENEKGIDIRLAVNFLAPYLLTKELLPLLEKAPGSRIINLSSAAQSPVSLKALKGKEKLEVNNAYAQSKLALTMWSFDLAKQLENPIIIAVNPGSLLNTKMANEAYGQHWSPADKGADILYQLAVEEKHLSDSGKYFDNDKGMFAQAHADAYSQSKIDHLISETDRILNAH